MRAIIKFTFLSTLVFAGLAIQASAQQPMMVGGYADASIKDKEIRRAAAVAIRALSKSEHHSVTLVKINKAEKQVVSGMNYRVCMDVREGGRRNRARTITAVVYEPIRKPMRLTNSQEGGCKEL
jgi:hypothetical protein